MLIWNDARTLPVYVLGVVFIAFLIRTIQLRTPFLTYWWNTNPTAYELTSWWN